MEPAADALGAAPRGRSRRGAGRARRQVAVRAVRHSRGGTGGERPRHRDRRPGVLDPRGVRRRPRRGRPAALHEHPDAVPGPAAAPAGRPQPDRGLRARDRGPGGVERPADRAARRRRGERSAGPRRRCRGRRRQGLPPGERVRPHCAPDAGQHQHVCGSPSSSGPTRASSRIRTSGGTAASPAPSSSTRRLPCTSRTSTSWPTSPRRTAPPSAPRSSRVRRRRAGCGSTSTWAPPATTSRPGGARRSACSGRATRSRPPHRCRRPRLWTAPAQPASRRAFPPSQAGRIQYLRAAGVELSPPRTPPWEPARTVPPAARDGPAAARGRGPGGARRGRRSCRSLYDLEVTLHGPDGEAVERATYRVGFRRVEIVGNDLFVNGVRVMLRGSQPARFRPPARPHDQPAAVPRRPAGDEAVRVQRRADVALPQRPRPARRRATSSACSSSTRPTSSATPTPTTSGHARVHGRVRRTGWRGWSAATRTTRA